MHYLITGCNGDVSLALARILRQVRKSSRIIGAAPDGQWPAQSLFDRVYKLPYASDLNFISRLKEIIVKEKIQILIPVPDAELRYISGLESIEQELACKVLMNPPNLLSVFLDKYRTYQWLKDRQISVPDTCLLSEATKKHLPIIAKPIEGAGSKNITLVRSPLMLEAYQEWYRKNDEINDYVAQAFIDVPDEEYTAAFLKQGSHLKTIAFRRKLYAGVTEVAHVVKNPTFDELFNRISNNITSDCFLNIQFRMRNRIPYIFEINPRFSSTVMMRHKIGFTDFLWALNYMEEKILPGPHSVPPSTKIYRMTEEIIVT